MMLWTFVYKYLYKCLFSVLLGWNCIYMCRGGTAESYDALFHFLRSKQTIFGPANHFCNHFTLAPAMFEGSISSHLCQYLFYLFFFFYPLFFFLPLLKIEPSLLVSSDISLWFWVAFPNGQWCWASFHVLVSCLCNCGEMYIQVQCPFLKWVVLLLL